LREALVTEALAIITRNGPAALTLRNIAASLGVSQTAPYRHFESKDALLGAVAAQGFDALLASSRHAVDQAGRDPLARFDAIVLAYVEFALRHPAHFKLMYDAGDEAFQRSDAVTDLRRTAFKLLVGLVADCQAAGFASPGEKPTHIAVKVWAFTHGLIVLYQNQLLGSLDEAQLRIMAKEAVLFLRPGGHSPPGSESG
jgi:AcrR family transcriptional regulator